MYKILNCQLRCFLNIKQLFYINPKLSGLIIALIFKFYYVLSVSVAKGWSVVIGGDGRLVKLRG